MPSNMTYVGEIQAVSDLTAAWLIRKEGSETQQAIDERVAPVAEEVLSRNPALIESAAASASTRALADAGLVRRSSPLLATPGPVTRPHAWTDPAGRTSLYDAPDGHVRAPLAIYAPAVGMPTTEYLSGTYDPVTGRWAEDIIGLDGLVPEVILQRWASRMQLAATVRTAGVALTCSAGSSLGAENATAVHVRYPFRVAPKVRRMRVHVRNFRDRDAVAFPGALAVTGMWWGQHARTTTGALSGNFTAAPTQIQNTFSTPADGAEFVTDWITVDTAPGGEYLLSFAYTCAAQTNHKAIGGCWRSTATGEASSAVPATALTQANTAPLDVWIEVEVAGDTPVLAGFGDSLTAGTSASLPVYDSWLAKHALAHGAIPQHYANHGSLMSDWAVGSAWKYQKYSGLTRKPNAVLWALGSNDWADGQTLSAMQDRFTALLPVVRAQIAEQVFLGNLMPRTTKTADDTVRVAYNAWLDTLPGGTVNVFDFASRVASATDPSVIDARWAAPDGIHLVTAGYARMARGITNALAA